MSVYRFSEGNNLVSTPKLCLHTNSGLCAPALGGADNTIPISQNNQTEIDINRYKSSMGKIRNVNQK